MTMKSHSDISVPHTGGWLRLTVDIPDHDALDADEAEFITKITDMVYGRLRDMIGPHAASRLSQHAKNSEPGGSSS